MTHDASPSEGIMAPVRKFLTTRIAPSGAEDAEQPIGWTATSAADPSAASRDANLDDNKATMTDILSLIQRASTAINEADARSHEVNETARLIAARVRQEVQAMRNEAIASARQLEESKILIRQLEEQRNSADDRALSADIAAHEARSALLALQQVVEKAFGGLSPVPQPRANLEALFVVA